MSGLSQNLSLSTLDRAEATPQRGGQARERKGAAGVRPSSAGTKRYYKGFPKKSTPGTSTQWWAWAQKGMVVLHRVLKAALQEGADPTSYVYALRCRECERR